MTKEEARKIVKACMKVTYDGRTMGPKTQAKLKEALKILFSKEE